MSRYARTILRLPQSCRDLARKKLVHTKGQGAFLGADTSDLEDSAGNQLGSGRLESKEERREWYLRAMIMTKMNRYVVKSLLCLDNDLSSPDIACLLGGTPLNSSGRQMGVHCDEPELSL